jgi:hypothetical protein
MGFLAVSGYTDGTYRRHAEELQKSLERFGIPLDLSQMPDLGSWEKNVRQKAEFLQKKSEEHPDDDLLWVDADSVVRRLPVLPEGDYSVAVYVYFPTDANPDASALDGHVFNGTIFLRADAFRDRILDLWALKNRERQDLPEQYNMKWAISRSKAGFRALPAEWCWVERIMRKSIPYADPVIEQFAVGLAKTETS